MLYFWAHVISVPTEHNNDNTVLRPLPLVGFFNKGANLSKALYTKFSLIRFQEKMLLLCKELVAY